MSKTKTLVAAAKCLERKDKKTWLDKLTPKQRQQIIELKEALKANQFPPHVSISRLWTDVVKPAGISVGKTTFQEWIQQ